MQPLIRIYKTYTFNNTSQKITEFWLAFSSKVVIQVQITTKISQVSTKKRETGRLPAHGHPIEVVKFHPNSSEDSQR